MYCQKCGARLEEGSAFCAHCGQQVAEAAAINSDGGNVQTFRTKKRPRMSDQIFTTIGALLLCLAALIYMEESNSYYGMRTDFMTLIVIMFFLGIYSLVVGVMGLIQTPKIFITISEDRVKGKTTVAGPIPVLTEFDMSIQDIIKVEQWFGFIGISRYTEGRLAENILIPHLAEPRKVLELLNEKRKPYMQQKERAK